MLCPSEGKLLASRQVTPSPAAVQPNVLPMPDAEFLDEPFFPQGMSQPDPSDPINAGFFEAAANGKLVVQSCADCDVKQYPPELICHTCYSFNMTWTESAGVGAIWSWVEVVHPAHPALREFGPYVVALVELEDLPEIKVMGAVVNAPTGTDTDPPVAIGNRVQVVFERSADDLVQPRWKLA